MPGRVGTLQYQLLPLGLQWPVFTCQAQQPYPSPRGVEGHTLKSALKAPMLPSTAVDWHPILSTLPPSKGEKPSEPWILLEVECPLTHSLLKKSTPSQGSDGIPAVILLLVYLCTGWLCLRPPTGWGTGRAVAVSCPLDEAEFEVSTPSPPQTKLQGTLPWGPRVRTKGGNLRSEDF